MGRGGGDLDVQKRRSLGKAWSETNWWQIVVYYPNKLESPLSPLEERVNEYKKEGKMKL